MPGPQRHGAPMLAGIRTGLFVNLTRGPRLLPSDVRPEQWGTALGLPLFRDSTKAPVWYVIVTLPLVLFLVFATPPMQVPDETNHFLRAVQLSQGEVFGEKLARNDAGGRVDIGAAIFS